MKNENTAYQHWARQQKQHLGGIYSDKSLCSFLILNTHSPDFDCTGTHPTTDQRQSPGLSWQINPFEGRLCETEYSR